MKPWQHGRTLDELDRVVDVFNVHDAGVVLGPFTTVNRRTVADWYGRGQLIAHAHGVLVVDEITRRRALHGFAGDEHRLVDGDVLVHRVAWSTSAGYSFVRSHLDELSQRRRCFVQLWREHAGQTALADELGARFVTVKIPTSSELLGVYVLGGACCSRLEPVDLLELVRTPLRFDVTALAEAVEQLDEWSPHYSKYNIEHSWHALALRGYGGDPKFIEKPAEMGRAWQKAHTDECRFTVVDTPLRKQLAPLVDPIIDALPGRKQRIRLMKLRPNGGRLDRHNDIGDPEAGTRDGQIMRMHVPVITNDDVLFNSWSIGGATLEARMRAGECWYLDTRKPHAAANGGQSDRVHLVVDVHASPALRKLVE